MKTARSANHSGAIDTVSPRSLAIISLCLFLMAWLVPPVIYTRIIEEPDLVFLDPLTLIFFLLCFAAFLVGARYGEHFAPRFKTPKWARAENLPPAMFVGLPLVAALIVCAVSFVLIARTLGGAFALLWALNGAEIKGAEVAMDQHLPLGMANTWLLGVIWWASVRSETVALNEKSRLALRILIIAGLVLCLADAVLKVSRLEVMMPLAGAYMMRFRSVKRRGMSPVKRLATMLLLGVAVVGFFVLFSFIRGTSPDEFLESFLGYTIVSYNRLAALLHGQMSYYYGGRGLYIVNFLGANNALNGVIPIRSMLSWPDMWELWRAEFGTVAAAGLNEKYIWSSAFGYIFGDLGWMSIVWVFGYGVFAGLAWRGFKRGSLFGAVLYPWTGFCILFWFGTNAIGDNKTLMFFAVVSLIYCYEVFFGPGSKRTSGATSNHWSEIYSARVKEDLFA
jgi:hypothetical protein